jgi:hypothetical protein
VPGKYVGQDKSIVDEVTGVLAALLPAGWSVAVSPGGGASPAWVVTAPDSAQANTDLLVADAPSPREIRPVRAGAPGVMVARYLSPATRAKLADLAWGYADTTGNIAICLQKPGLVVRVHGADRDPGPRLRPNRTLKGPRAARLVRALCDAPLPLTLSELGRRTGIDLGYASRLLDWMVQEGFLDRDRRGPVTSVAVRALLGRWAEGYSVLATHRAIGLRDPQGAAGQAERMKALATRYAITGTFAANRLAVFSPRRPMLVYAERPSAVIDGLALVAGDDDADVILLDPVDPFVFERTWSTGGLVFASPSQIAVDLLTGPHDGRPFADDVIAWIERRRQ